MPLPTLDLPPLEEYPLGVRGAHGLISRSLWSELKKLWCSSDGETEAQRGKVSPGVVGQIRAPNVISLT